MKASKEENMGFYWLTCSENSKKHNCRREYDPFVCLTAHSIFLIHVILLADFFEIVDILIRLIGGKFNTTLYHCKT